MNIFQNNNIHTGLTQSRRHPSDLSFGPLVHLESVCLESVYIDIIQIATDVHGVCIDVNGTSKS